MIEKIEGIVVSEVLYKNSSKIISILTSDGSLFSVLAQGATNYKNKFSKITNVMDYGIFHIKNKNGKYVLVDGDIIDCFKMIKKDIIKTSYALYIIELAHMVIKNILNKFIYINLLDGLKKINLGFDPAIITNIIEVKYLDYLGILPEFNKCVNCGCKNNIVTISSYKGGYLCGECSSMEHKYNLKTLKLVKMFYLVDINKISKLDINLDIKKEINLFLSDYYDRYSGLYLKSKKMIESLEAIL